jgi:hypothetical protein
VFSDGVYHAQIRGLSADPDGNHDRVDLRQIDAQKIKVRGYNHAFGDQPGYSRGREITVESGKIVLGKLGSDVYEEVRLDVAKKTVNGTTVTELKGTANKYIRAIILYYSDAPSAQDVRIHLLFKFDVADSSICNGTNYRNKVYYRQESIIDNVGLAPAKEGAGKYVAVDCRYHTADIIEVHGSLVNITGAVAICTDEKVYRENVIVTQSYASTFDAKGRLFVFYEDRNVFTKTADGEDVECLCPSSPSPSSSSGQPPTGPGTPNSGGGGGGGGGGGPGTGGVPGGGPGTIVYPPAPSSSSSSAEPSSSNPPQPSSSSPPPEPSSSSGSPTVPDCLGEDRGCLGCPGELKKTYNSFSVSFSGFSQQELCRKCNACDDSDGAFLHIAPADVAGPFCVIQNCTETCLWENTVYVPAISKKCVNTSCDDVFAKTLIPVHIVAKQTNAGWALKATAMDADCNTFVLFDGFAPTPENGNPCDPPGAIANNSYQPSLFSDDVCCICFPDVKEVSNISVAMSPDMGNTWFDFKGIIRTTEGELARKPVVALDPMQNKFHLFYIFQGRTTSGLMHKVIDAALFDEHDAFVPYYPIPEFSADTDDSAGISQFTPKGQTLRKLPSKVVSGNLSTEDTEAAKTRFKSGKSFRFYAPEQIQSFVKTGFVDTALQSVFFGFGDPSKDVAANEEYAAYVDNQGRLYFYYFDQRGTLPLDKIDVPDVFVGGRFGGKSLIRARQILRNAVICQDPYVFEITGVTDGDCECKSLAGQHTFTPRTADMWESKHFVLKLEDRYWTLHSKNGMMTWRRKRNSVKCPPTGPFDLRCNRCIGTDIKGVLYGNSSSSSLSAEDLASSSSGTIRPFDAKVRVFSSADDGFTWKEELPGRGGHYGSLAYDSKHDYAYMFYVTDDMLFCRRYPAHLYQPINGDEGTSHIEEETLLVPISTLDFDYRAIGGADAIGVVGGIQDQIGIPPEIEEEIISTTIPDGTPLAKERDKHGLPVFVIGEKTGDFRPVAHFPYPKDYKFDNGVGVAAARPAAYITPEGSVRFFYVDANGNINGGILLSERPLVDTKLKVS